MHVVTLAMNGGVLSGFLATIYKIWIVGENPKCFEVFIDEKTQIMSPKSMVFNDILMIFKNALVFFYTKFNSKFPNFQTKPHFFTKIRISHRQNHQNTSGFLLRSRIFILLPENHSEHPHSLRVDFCARKLL